MMLLVSMKVKLFSVLFVLLFCLSVKAVRLISTSGHQMPQTSSNPAPQPAVNQSPSRQSSSSSPSNAQGSKHDPIDIELIPVKKSPKHQHQGRGSKTDPIQISDLGERTRPIEIYDSQQHNLHNSGTSPVRHRQRSKNPKSDTAAGHSSSQRHSLYASKKRPYGKSTVIGMQQGSSSTSKRGRKATSSAGSVPDDSINRKRNRNRNRQEVAKAVLGESSANSLSPSNKKARKPRKLTKSVSSKQQEPLKEVKKEPISTELSLSTSPKAWGPRNAIKKDRVEHARARLLAGEYQQHGSKEHPIEISAGQQDRKQKMERIRKHTRGELIRQIHAADQRKKQMKIEKKSDENIVAEPKKSSSSSHDGKKGNNGLDLNLHLRRRGVSSEDSNGSSTRLQLGHFSRTNNQINHSMTTRSRTQPSYTPQHATQQSRHYNIAINESNRAPIGGPLRHQSGSVRSTTVHPYGSQHYPLTHQGQMQGHTNHHTQALIAQYRSAHIRSLQLTRPIHVIHPIPRSPIIRPVPIQPIHQQETPISPGSQNLIDRVGHSQGRQSQSYPPSSDPNNSPVNLNLSLG